MILLIQEPQDQFTQVRIAGVRRIWNALCLEPLCNNMANALRRWKVGFPYAETDVRIVQ